MGVIKLTFYSGKLWHSDKPFLVREYFHSLSFEDNQKLYLNHIKENWLSTAYEVTETNLTLEHKKRILNHNNISCGEGAGWEIAQAWDTQAMFDGDQITLPEGHGIEISEDEYKARVGSGECLDRTATITLPEQPAKVDSVQWQDIMIGAGDDYPVTEYAKSKPDNSAHGFCVTPGSTCNMNYCDENGCQDRKRELVEPSESQEEQIHIWCDVFKVMDTTAHYKVEQELLEKFTITRK